MIIWLDAHLSPRLARWLNENFPVQAHSLRFLKLRSARDPEIFFEAREAQAVMLTKDEDFPKLLKRYGSPPKVLWLTCGNTSEAALRQLLELHFLSAMERLEAGEDLVEIP